MYPVTDGHIRGDEVEIAYTRAKAAQTCGLPGKTIDEAIRSGELPATKSGRRLIILAEDIQAWLRRCKDRGEIPPRAIDDSDRTRLAACNRGKRKAEIAP